MYNVVTRIAKKRFDNQLNNLCNRCNVKARFILPREFVVREVKAAQISKQKTEERREKVKQLPLIGRLISRHISVSDEDLSQSEFILSLMDNLELDCLGTDELNQIRQNKEEIYEKYYRSDYEYYASAQLSDYMANGLPR